MSILIRNLPRTTTETELETLFKPFGDVISCDIVMDKETGQSKGFGFVEMADEQSTDAAIAALNGTVLVENKLRVKWSNQEKNRPQTEMEATKDYKNAWSNLKPNRESHEPE